MEYREDREASAGLLRIALQRMSQHPAALTPICYTVWYEYLAGINPHLVNSMDDRLGRGELLDDAAIQDLYKRYCSEFSIEMQLNVRENAQRILGDIQRLTEDAHQHTSEFGGHLAESANALSHTTDSDALRQVVQMLQKDTALMAASMDGLSQSLESSYSEIEDLRRQLESAKAEAMVDPLTGVMNRRGFDASITQAIEISRMTSAPLSLVVLDIDHFKRVNDTYGHLFGDKVISGLAAVLRANIKGKDGVARLGGEEFGLVLPETDLEGARQLSEKIRRMMELSKIRRLDKNEQIGGITISLGVATLSEDEGVAEFMDRADKAMYASKGNGRNRVTIAHV